LSRTYVWPLATSLIIAILGGALMVWPWAAHAVHGHWTRAASVDFYSGLGITVTGLLGLAGWYGGLRRDLLQQGVLTVRRAAPPPEPAAAPAAAPEDDLDRLLRPLAETVLRDLSEQLAAKEGRHSGGGALS
jgi:hypothetical protein